MCSCGNGKYVRSIIDYSVITCDEIVDVTESTSTKTFSAETISTNFYILLALVFTLKNADQNKTFYCHIKSQTTN